MTGQDEDRQEPSLLSDEEVHRRIMANPEIRARVEEVIRQVKIGGSKDAGLGPEALEDFLRDQGQGLDPR